MHAGAGSGGVSGGGAAHRRRKKRSNYGIRTVEVNRGSNGFGFTISGQQPCILSCIVTGSPADLAGLRAGDFLISVNGLNVSKLPHESVVQLIGGTHGTIRMAIAENYYSDSSDEDILFQHSGQQARARPKYPHKAKFSRAIASSGGANGPNVGGTERSIAGSGGPAGQEELTRNDSSPPPPGTTAYNVIHSPNASNSCDISNVSAMVRSVQLGSAEDELAGGQCAGPSGQERHSALEYQAVVGYLGTIEMPKQIATSSKLQTVRSCIRKMRQEKRNPTTVLMTILPSCLNLTNTSNNLIAKYASARLSYVSSSSESDNKYFGLVTSAIYADGLMCDSADDVLLMSHPRKDVVISNSCHVFVIDGKLAVEHELHLEKAAIFRIVCTKDPITNLCLEFPSNSEYVVNLIRSMYSLKSPVKPGEGGSGSGSRKPPVARSLNLDGAGAGRFPRNRSDPRLNPSRADGDAHDVLAANSPQPSNHSEITTTSSNSDSGIGFHNDCRNISDRILLVDFPGMLGPQQQRLLQQQQIANVRAHYRKSHPFLRPAGIINEIPPKMDDPIRNIRSTTGAMVGPAHSSRLNGGLQIAHGKSKSADYSYPSTSAGGASGGFVDRLTVRARPDPKVFASDRSPSKENVLNAYMHDEVAGRGLEPPDSEALMPLGVMEDPWTYDGRTLDEQGNVVEERPIDVPPMENLFLDLDRYNNDNVKNSLLAARSCDDMILSLGKESMTQRTNGGGQRDGDGAPADVLLDVEAYERLKVKLSIDDLTLISVVSEHEAGAPPDNGSSQHVFLQPLKPVKRSKKACTTHTSRSATGKLAAIHHDDIQHGGVRHRGDKLAAYKLSPKVFGLPRPISISFENISTLSATDGTGHSGRDSAANGGACLEGGGNGSGHKGSHKPGNGTPGGSGRKSRSAKRLSGGFSAIWGSLQELRSGGGFGKSNVEESGRGKHDETIGPIDDPSKKKNRERRLSGLKLLEATYSEPDLRYDEKLRLLVIRQTYTYSVDTPCRANDEAEFVKNSRNLD
ncbi:AGAP002411-PB-like protein [Anopheles sinensis]|uniref:AGAP002411-PB-like protein n=1 Tax=Anopheles sinensis TaxID=74873 RepID=A0A084VSD8_ANOSI|nr:AGAP002411-PB-like protein [Anopheles sinensis]